LQKEANQRKRKGGKESLSKKKGSERRRTNHRKGT